MKRRILLPLIVTSLALALGPVGCKKSPKGITPIPGSPTDSPQPVGVEGPNDLSGNTLPQDSGVREGEIEPMPDGGFPQGDWEYVDGWRKDKTLLEARTVYFDFDSSFVKVGEQYKVNAVGDYLNDKPSHGLLIDGHCDERGTEEYNRALGQRRADALREYLVQQYSFDPVRIRTRSFGEDQPADPSPTQAAWELNRRGEFILLLP